MKEPTLAELKEMLENAADQWEQAIVNRSWSAAERAEKKYREVMRSILKTRKSRRKNAEEGS